MAALAPQSAASGRRFHVCLAPDAIEADPALLGIVRHAGVSDVWTTGFLYGHWYYSLDRIARAVATIRQAGLAAHIANVPLGHPGDALGAKSGTVPLTPPAHWKPAIQAGGRTRWGTSLHAPATEENVRAIHKLAGLGVDRIFLDDDFRLADSPGAIGGCFCAEHVERFRKLHGYGANARQEVIEAVKNRELTPPLRAWVDFCCDELTASFRAQQDAAPRVRLGIMVMYFGSEKAGIRLPDYKGVPFRVGEFMFDDRAFRPVKGKTDELFSVLFHRRFAAPQLAFSETTAFPAAALSASNLAAKLAVSTIADVRNTMFMSGLTPFPPSHWDTLGPAMKKNAEIHRKLAGHAPRGPFKHFWGEHSRYVGDDRPYSLFLATGVPFEITGRPASDGWTFLSEADAKARLRSPGTVFVDRSRIPETLAELFRLKAQVRGQSLNAPMVIEDKPAVCAWYPTARSVLLWNLSGERESLTLEHRGRRKTVSVGPLDLELVADVA